MNNVRQFRQTPSRDHDHDQQAPAAPDVEELQRLLGLVVGTAFPGKAHSEREIRIRNFRSSRLELVDDLIVMIEERADQYVASSYDTGQYGIGYSPDDAIQDLCSVLEEYYELLLEDEGRLSRDLEAHLTYLRTILRARK